MKTRILYILLLLMTQTLFAQYASPVNFPIHLAGNVGEIRPAHFHSGIDIKAVEGVGSPVSAIEDGYISRIGVSPTGYGNVLYLTLNNGETAVYAHLNGFRSDIAEWVKARQYGAKQFKINQFLHKGQFPVKKGELIGYLGNSGSSGGPHLHFEIRSAAAAPQNLMHNKTYYVKDDIAPSFFEVSLFECDTINGVKHFKRSSKIVNVRDTLYASGDFYLAYEVIDFKNGFSNTMGIYSLEQKVNNETNFSFALNSFSFATTKYIDTFTQWDLNKKSKYHYLRAYVSENNKLLCYSKVKNRGIIQPTEEPIKVTTTIEDDNFNKNSFTFYVKRKEKTQRDSTSKIAVKWRDTFTYSDSVLVVRIDRGSLYDDALLEFASNSQQGIYRIGDKNIPLHKSIIASIKNSGNKPTSKALLYNKDIGAISMANYNNGYFSGEVRAFGDYTIVYDTIAPKVIKRGFKDKKLSFEVSDDLSGIEKYELRIDGKWELCSWDPKTRLMMYKAPKTDDAARTNKYVLTVEDYSGNKTKTEGTFKN